MSFKSKKSSEDKNITPKYKNNRKTFLAAIALVGIGSVVAGIVGAALTVYSSKSNKDNEPEIYLSSNNYDSTIFLNEKRNVDFRIQANTTLPTKLNYQWYSGTNINNGIALQNTNDSTLSLDTQSFKTANTYHFFVLVSGNFNDKTISVTSQVFNLQVINKPQVTFSNDATIDATVAETNYQTIYGDPVCNNKNTSLTYQWYKSDSNSLNINQLNQSQLIQNATNSFYTLTKNDVKQEQTIYYYLLVKGTINNDIFYTLSKPYTVVVQNQASITVSYNQSTFSATKGYDGSTITADVVNSVNLQDSYQWYTNNPIYDKNQSIIINSVTYYEIPNANNQWYSLTKTDTETVGTWTYLLQVTASQNGITIKSNNEESGINVVVSESPSIEITDSNNFQIKGYLQQSSDIILNPNILVNGQDPNDSNVSLSYQWYSNSYMSNENGTLLKNQINASLVINNKLLITSNLYYYLVVTAVILNSANKSTISATSTVFHITLSQSIPNKISIGDVTSNIIASNNSSKFTIYNQDLTNLPSLKLLYNQTLPTNITDTIEWSYAYYENGKLTSKIVFVNNETNINLANYQKVLNNLFLYGGVIYATSTLSDSISNQVIQIQTISSYTINTLNISSSVVYSKASYSLYTNQATQLPTLSPTISYDINGVSTSQISDINGTIKYQWYKENKVISSSFNATANSSSYIFTTNDTNNQTGSINYYLIISLEINNETIILNQANKDNEVTISFVADPTITVQNNLPNNTSDSISYYLTQNQSANLPVVSATVSSSVTSFSTISYVWTYTNLYTNKTETSTSSNAFFNLNKILSTAGKYEIWLMVKADFLGISLIGNSEASPFIIMVNPTPTITLTSNTTQNIEVNNTYQISANIDLNNLDLTTSEFNAWQQNNIYTYKIQMYSLSNSLNITSFDSLFNWTTVESGSLTFINKNNTITSTVNFRALLKIDSRPLIQYRIVVMQNNTNLQITSDITNIKPIFSSNSQAQTNLNDLLQNPDYDIGLIWQYNNNQTKPSNQNNNFLNVLTDVNAASSSQAVEGWCFANKWWASLQSISYIQSGTSEKTYGLNYNAPFSSFVLTYKLSTDAVQTVKNSSWNTIASFTGGSILKFYLPLNFFESVVSSTNPITNTPYTITLTTAITATETTLSWGYNSSFNGINNIFFVLYHSDNDSSLTKTWNYPNLYKLDFSSSTTITTTYATSWSWLPIYNV